MEPEQKSKKRKWWNNGWLGLLVLILTFATLFVIGRYSATYEPNPVIEGRQLSEWTDDLKSIGWEDAEHEEAVAVLISHKEEVIPVFVTWLRERDTFAQTVYLFTMTVLEGKGDLLDYRGSYFNQLHAARALKQIGDGRAEVLNALNDVVHQYDGTGHYAGEVAQNTLQKLKAQQVAAPNP
jgi:hypothetical protein